MRRDAYLRFDPTWRRLLCAPDAFKESLPAVDVAATIAETIESAHPTITVDQCPLADGGEGLVETMVAARGGRIEQHRVDGPRGTPVEAPIGWIDDDRTAIVGIADASGLALLRPAERDPMRTTTFGTGVCIRHAIEHGAQRVIVGLGGSATCDGAAGLTQALGVRFYDEHDVELPTPMTGGSLSRIRRIERPVIDVSLTVLCDVTNPLLGQRGAAATFGPQKGATPVQVDQLDAGLANLAHHAGGEPSMIGAGAAGGAGFGLATLLGATLEPGVDVVMRHVRFHERVRMADLVITGEGRLDAQSMSGKVVMRVADRAAQAQRRTVAIVGTVGDGWRDCVEPRYAGRLAGVIALTDLVVASSAMARPREALRSAVTSWMGGPSGSEDDAIA